MLIIYAHPHKKGHCGQILSTVEAMLRARHQSYEILDLYAEKYNPVLSDKEHYSSGGTLLSSETKKLQDLISKHDTLLVIFPVWWNSVPAILKGFFDKVLTPPFAFKYVGKRPKGMLSGRKAAVVATTGAPAIYNFLLAGNRAIKTVVRDTLSFCGFKTRGHVIDQATQLNEKQKMKIVRAVGRSLDFLLS